MFKEKEDQAGAAREQASSIEAQTPMNAYGSYARWLQDLASNAFGSGLNHNVVSSISEILDGQPGKVLRERVPYAIRREFGAFASGIALSTMLVGDLPMDGVAGLPTYFDPACGTGDLLLACARQLPVFPDLPSTLENWGRHLKGFDLHPEFIQVTKARLILMALTLCPPSQTLRKVDFESLFPCIRQGDGLAAIRRGVSATNIVLNPPFCMMRTAEPLDWSSGQVSSAAVFINTCLSNAEHRTQISAVLPDVLRSGTRYEKWRKRVAERVTSLEIAAVGLFDKWCDVDVFVLRAEVGDAASEDTFRWADFDTAPNYGTVGDRFRVNVGPVVPHRHKEEGPALPYICAQGLPVWGNFSIESAPKRRFFGTTFDPPFVVVRRTSRPSTLGRALATLIEGSEPVAVENHLVVLTPKDHSDASCRDLIQRLRDRKADNWLDNRIRCRHLTVGALQELPWWVHAETALSRSNSAEVSIHA